MNILEGKGSVSKLATGNKQAISFHLLREDEMMSDAHACL